MSETGESTAQINRRADDEAWARAEPKLRKGCTLTMPGGLGKYCIQHPGGALEGPTVTKAGIRRWEREGRIAYIGPHRYALTGEQA